MPLSPQHYPPPPQGYYAGQLHYYHASFLLLALALTGGLLDATAALPGAFPPSAALFNGLFGAVSLLFFAFNLLPSFLALLTDEGISAAVAKPLQAILTFSPFFFVMQVGGGKHADARPRMAFSTNPRSPTHPNPSQPAFSHPPLLLRNAGAGGKHARALPHELQPGLFSMPAVPTQPLACFRPPSLYLSLVALHRPFLFSRVRRRRRKVHPDRPRPGYIAHPLPRGLRHPRRLLPLPGRRAPLPALLGAISGAAARPAPQHVVDRLRRHHPCGIAAGAVPVQPARAAHARGSGRSPPFPAVVGEAHASGRGLRPDTRVGRLPSGAPSGFSRRAGRHLPSASKLLRFPISWFLSPPLGVPPSCPPPLHTHSPLVPPLPPPLSRHPAHPSQERADAKRSVKWGAFLLPSKELLLSLPLLLASHLAMAPYGWGPLQLLLLATPLTAAAAIDVLLMPPLILYSAISHRLHLRPAMAQASASARIELLAALCCGITLAAECLHWPALDAAGLVTKPHSLPIPHGLLLCATRYFSFRWTCNAGLYWSAGCNLRAVEKIDPPGAHTPSAAVRCARLVPDAVGYVFALTAAGFLFLADAALGLAVQFFFLAGGLIPGSALWHYGILGFSRKVRETANKQRRLRSTATTLVWLAGKTAAEKAAAERARGGRGGGARAKHRSARDTAQMI